MHYQYRFDVDQSSIDENGHVNNVEYVRWMQETATVPNDGAVPLDEWHQHG